MTFATAHAVIEAASDPELARIHEEAGLVACDGMPLVWCCRRAGFPWAERVYGPDVLLALSERAASRGYRCYFHGGRPGVARALADRLARRFPGLQVVGAHSPPFRTLQPAERAEEVRRINASGAHLVWVGLGAPKQERWMADRRPDLRAPVLLGVGAAFDIHAGMVRQAPAWMRRRGLEWAFRLGVEPRRLWRRYLVTNPAFVLGVLRRPPQEVAGPAQPDPAR